MFEWLDGSAARQSNWMFKERIRQIFKWLDSSAARQANWMLQALV